jgi:hypothetical protein
MPEGTVSYRIFAALDEAAPYDLFMSDLYDDSDELRFLDLEEFDLIDTNTKTNQ